MWYWTMQYDMQNCYSTCVLKSDVCLSSNLEHSNIYYRNKICSKIWWKLNGDRTVQRERKGKNSGALLAQRRPTRQSRDHDGGVSGPDWPAVRAGGNERLNPDSNFVLPPSAPRSTPRMSLFRGSLHPSSVSSMHAIVILQSADRPGPERALWCDRGGVFLRRGEVGIASCANLWFASRRSQEPSVVLAGLRFLAGEAIAGVGWTECSDVMETRCCWKMLGSSVLVPSVRRGNPEAR